MRISQRIRKGFQRAKEFKKSRPANGQQLNKSGASCWTCTCVEEELVGMESADCTMDLVMDDDKLNGKPDSRHNARNIHVGFSNFPLFVFGLWGFS
jgi:hypothetical protein